MFNNKSFYKNFSILKHLGILAAVIIITTFSFELFDQSIDLLIVINSRLKRFIEISLILIATVITTYFIFKKQNTLIYQINNDINEYNKAQQKLYETTERFKELFEHAPDAYFVTDIGGKIIDNNAASQEISQYSKNELIKKYYAKLFPDFQQKIIEDDLNAANKGYPTGPEELILIKKDSNPVDIEVRSFPITINNNSVILATAREITERKKIVEALKQAERKYRLLVESLPNVMRISDSKGYVKYISPNVVDIYGYAQEEMYRSNIDLTWISRIHPQDKERIKYALRQLLLGQPYNLEYRIQKKNDDWIWIHDIAQLVEEDSQNFIYAVFTDITKRKKMEREIKHLAYYDTVTDLPNRRLLKVHFNKAAALAKRNELIMAILFLDLDRFKQVNDQIGHDAGDLLLKEIGNRLVEILRSADTLARVGGDEFVVLLSDIKNTEDAGKIADKMCQVTTKPFKIFNHEVNVSASIGISLFPFDGQDLQTLIVKADDAMRVVKEKSGNGYKFSA